MNAALLLLRCDTRGQCWTYIVFWTNREESFFFFFFPIPVSCTCAHTDTHLCPDLFGTAWPSFECLTLSVTLLYKGRRTNRGSPTDASLEKPARPPRRGCAIVQHGVCVILSWPVLLTEPATNTWFQEEVLFWLTTFRDFLLPRPVLPVRPEWRKANLELGCH